MSVPWFSAESHAALLDLALAIDGQDIGAGLVGQERRLRHHERLLRLGSSTSTPTSPPAISVRFGFGNWACTRLARRWSGRPGR